MFSVQFSKVLFRKGRCWKAELFEGINADSLPLGPKTYAERLGDVLPAADSTDDG